MCVEAQGRVSVLALVTSLRKTLPLHQRLLRPIHLSLALKGHSPGPFRCLPNSFQTSSSWGRRAQTPSPTPHFSPVGDKAWGSPPPKDPSTVPTLSQSRGLCRDAAMDDIFTQCREGNAVAVRLWLDNTENDLNQG